MDCKKYLEKVFPIFDYINIDQHAITLTKYPHLRFELGGDLKSCSDERLNQAYSRSLDLILQIFSDKAEQLYLIINDHGANSLFTRTPFEYIYCLITGYEKHNKEEIYFKDSEGKGQKFLQHIYTLRWDQIDYKKILEGIANLEQGRSPSISQTIFFINLHSNIVFYMYDDRGCLIVSNNANKLRKIYQERNGLIVDYHRPEIDKYFP